MIVAKNGSVGYFFVSVCYKNQGVQHDLALVIDWLI